MKITVLTQHLCTAHGGSHTTLHDTHVPQTDPLQPEPDANAAPCPCRHARSIHRSISHITHITQELEIASGTLNKPFVPVRTLTTSTTCLPPRGGTAAKAGKAETHTQTAGRIDARRADAGWKSKTKIQEDRAIAFPFAREGRGMRVSRTREAAGTRQERNSKSEKSETAEREMEIASASAHLAAARMRVTASGN
eukprot:scaffold50741_cov68-Phaeocystis_antarctica.AAC.1